MNQQQEINCAIEWATYMEQERQSKQAIKNSKERVERMREWERADTLLNISLVLMGVAIGIMVMMLLILWGV